MKRRIDDIEITPTQATAATVVVTVLSFVGSALFVLYLYSQL